MNDGCIGEYKWKAKLNVSAITTISANHTLSTECLTIYNKYGGPCCKYVTF